MFGTFRSSKLMVLLLIIKFFGAIQASSNAFCKFYVEGNGAYYDLRPLIRNTSDYVHYVEQNAIKFNFCRATQQNCRLVPPSFAIIENLETRLCEQLAPDDPNFNVTPKNSADPSEGILISYKEGRRNPFTGTPFSLQIDIACSTDFFIIRNHTNFSSNMTLYAASKQACPVVTTSSMFFFIQSNARFFHSATWYFLELYLLFFGFRFYRITRFILGLSLWWYVIPWIILTSHPVESEFWIISMNVVAIMLGVWFALLCKKYKALGAFVVGSIGGYFWSLMIYDSILVFLGLTIYHLIYTEAVMTVTGGILFHGFYKSEKFKLAIEVLTSFVGSYIIVRGFTLGWNGFLSEMVTAEALSKGVFDKPDPWYPLVLGVLWGLGILGCVVQYRINKTRGVKAVGASDQEEATTRKQSQVRKAIITHTRENEQEFLSQLSKFQIRFLVFLSHTYRPSFTTKQNGSRWNKRWSI